MKHKIYSTLLICIICATSGFTTVYADAESTTFPTSETSVSVETTVEETESTTDVVTDETLDISKTVKVNKKIKLKNSLNLDSSELKDYSFTADDNSIVKVTSAGTVTGLKTGTTTVTVTSDIDESIYATVNLDVKDNYSASQLRYMSAIIYSEACGEPYAGKKAVGIVVMNRVKSPLFPDTIRGVLYQKGQFTPIRNGSFKKAIALYDSGKMDPSCIAAAKEALNGTNRIAYKSTTINMSKTLFFSRYIPKRKFKIARHMFK